jgi:O-antigen biosynthesis protein
LARQPQVETGGDSRPTDKTNPDHQASNSTMAAAAALEQTSEIASETPLNFERTFWKHEGLLSDKWVQYLGIYEREVGRVIARRGPVRLLEIGVQNGGSLQIWRKALPAGSEVVGIDIDPRCAALDLGGNVRILIGDATDHETVERLLGNELFDVIVDDGSHISSDVIAAFFLCFPRVAPGGTYIIEDLHASYWASHGGGLQRPGSAIEFLKSLTDAVNADHFEANPGKSNPEIAELGALGAWIERVTFYDSVVAVQKREASKQRPYGRALSGLRAPLAPALDAILSVPSERLTSVAAAEATAHALDMQMLGEVRRRRIEAADLHNRLRTLEGELEGAHLDIDTLRAAQEAAQIQAAADIQTIRTEADTARAEIQTVLRTERAKREALRQLAETEVSRARLQRDNARVDASREIAFITAQRDAAIAQATAQRDAAMARVAAVESSGFWRITAPARHTLAHLPILHRLGQRAIRLAYWTSRGELLQRLREGTLVPPEIASPKVTLIDPVTEPKPVKSTEQPLFDTQHALITVPVPEDAQYCVIVPFDVIPQPSASQRIAVMIHSFYPEQLNRFLPYINEIPGDVDLFVTTDTETKRTLIEVELAGWRKGQIEVRILPNRGRDVAPKLFGLIDVYENYDLVLHLHTKRSLHSDRGDEWLEHLMRTLIGSERVIRSVLAAFEVQPKLGLLFADHWDPIRGFVNWGYNYPIAQELAARMGFSLSRDEPLDFPSGSMFWVRPAALAPLLGLHLRSDEFHDETGQVDGTTAHAIERLMLRVCEHSGHSWLRISHAEFFEGSAERAIHIGSIDTLRRVLKRHPVLLADPALRTSVRVLEGRPETWPMRIAPEFDDRPRVNLLIPTFRGSSVFGGIATAHALFERVADALGPEVERRMIMTSEDHTIVQSDLPPGWRLVGPTEESGDRSAVLLTRNTRFDHGLPVRPRDVFFASAWWDAAAAYGLMDLQKAFFGRAARIRYFIQDYEPNFSAWSASWASAEQTYHRPHHTVALVNSDFLAAYLDKLNLHFSRKHVFQPLWTQGLGQPDARSVDRENLLLVYWRPYVERNLSPIIVSALAQWLEEDPHAAQHWNIVGIGQDGDNVRLTDWRTMTIMGKLTLSQYTALLRRAKVGLGLMLSPHPSYPPLEMAAFGMRVVTNGFGPKDLSRFGNRIESVAQPTPDAVARAIHRATAAWADGEPTQVAFEMDEAFATEADLNVLAGAVGDEIRAELGIG